MECSVKWFGDARFTSTTGSGHEVHMEGGAGELDGRNQFARPMELILSGAGGCTAYDVVLFLKREGHDFEGVEVIIDAQRAETEPKVFTRIHFHFRISGKKLKPGIVERAIKLSKDKYCSASIMLGKTAEITHDFEIIDTGE